MSRSCRKTLVGALVALLAGLGVVPPAALAAPGSLYSGPGPRPGPDILYEPPATAPQLTNAGNWKAPSILVSGASAYRSGEFLYQDFLYDDHGARESPDPADPRANHDTFSKPSGTYTYPTDPAYAHNAADLVELRVKPLRPSTAFRITLNTLKDPSLVAFSIALGGTPGVSHPFPFGANVSAPADLFVTVHPGSSGLVAELTDAATGAPVSPTPPVLLDTARRQIEVRVARSAWDPTGKVVRLAAGIGLWNKANGRYLLPQSTADATHPGGSGSAASPPAFFNVAFRYNEPMPDVGDPAGTAQSAAWWRDNEQGSALAAGDISAFHADVDFRKLAANANDDMPDQPGGVPQSGPMDRILASHFETAQGADFSTPCFPSNESNCAGEYRGNLQPYAIYVPRQPMPARGYGMTLLLHSLDATYNQYLGSRNQSQFGERGAGSIVITPLARGPDGFYDSYAGADVFEVWADVASRFTLDPAWTVITGYSMGGIGTFKLGEQFPDLFSRAQPTVGYSQDNSLIPSLRNIPVLMWNASSDELVPQSSYLPTAQALDQAGYRYELDVFSGDHLTLAINDQYEPAAAFLGTAIVVRNPAHVTYVADPSLDHADLGFVADHAYWLSNVKPRSSGHGTVDAFSYGFGVGDRPPNATAFGSGTLTGGNLGTLAFTRQYKTQGAVPAITKVDRLDLTAQNVATATINPARAHVSCNVDLHLTSDGPLTVTLAGCNRTVQVP
jgi:C-terminal binding-module, SLH-like, of glucodextranase